ncbi:hypothetical protein HHI36_015569 [Cryptolaemus montrouzieri]|uniref:Uncharacterized protein n=1 Tax=Cryptolaemus montrouzieri TaxID=559131 RepID=A0ABD2N5Z3_9CUCU
MQTLDYEEHILGVESNYEKRIKQLEDRIAGYSKELISIEAEKTKVDKQFPDAETIIGALRGEILELKTVNEDKQSQIESLRKENRTGLEHLKISKEEIISLKMSGKNCSLKMLSERSLVQTIPLVDRQTQTDVMSLSGRKCM